MFEHLTSNYVDADGLRTHYVEQGDGAPVILIHGGGAGADGRGNFERNLSMYAKGYRAIAYDMPGFGLTDRPDPDDYAYTQDSREEHLIAFIEALGLGPVHLVGNSMGGSTACGAALRRPDLVSSLVLMGAAVNMSSEDMHKNRANLGAVLAYDDTREGMIRIVDSLTYDFSYSDELIDYRYKMSIRPEAKKAFKSLMGWVGQNGLDYGDALASLEMPVLVVAGKDDVMIPVAKQYELLEQVPSAKGVILPRCGHWVMMEYPEEFCAITMEFFGKAA
ncbi:alpha/beta hydrolase [uncultured Tateyamaria sp.]|uniref:alpha/beta fold hydrolase n=1 Tax=uncultured Tateyamaria sp. TaxID=455651 RepID=UPI00261541F8|nr:alpha/beta hydrolase [uncultured Tateyamaria sp.]